MIVEFANKKVVLLATPGAFTPTCSVKHIPPYIENLAVLKAKGVDLVAVVCSNDAWVMEAWRKANGVRDEIVSLFFPSVTLSPFPVGDKSKEGDVRLMVMVMTAIHVRLRRCVFQEVGMDEWREVGEVCVDC